MPALHINGGGTATREDAERACLDAIEFALEGDPSDYDSTSQAIAQRAEAPGNRLTYHRAVSNELSNNSSALGAAGVPTT